MSAKAITQNENIQVAPTTENCQPKVRTIRFATRKQAKKAGDWAMKRFYDVFRKLAE